MGADILMFIEQKNPKTNKWELVKNPNWEHDHYIVPIDRNTGLFCILCGYNKKDFIELPVISECKGLPSDINKESTFWLEDLPYTSYLLLQEILNYGWDKTIYYFDEISKCSEIAGDFYTKIIPYMKSLDSNYQNIRIVFGLSL